MTLSSKESSDFNQFFDFIYQGNEAAKAISFEILQLVHIWDDLYDKDKEVSPDQVNSAFFSAVYKLQENPLWQQCRLGEHMLNVILRWQDANVLEQELLSEHDLNKAYMLRAGVYDLFSVLCYHLFGMAWAQEVGPQIRRFYCESLEEYKEEMKNA